MDRYFEMLRNTNPVLLAVIIVIALGMTAIFLSGIFGSITKRKHSKQVKTNKPEEALQNPVESSSDVKCLMFFFENGENIARWTTMPNPVGRAHTADTSCLLSGGIYTVHKKEDGTLEDFEEYLAKDIELKETPEFAYFATHWDEVDDVFSVPLPWWQSMSVWFAAGAGVMAFFAWMAVFGG